MNNLSSCCGLVDAKIRASDKDLPVLGLLSSQFHQVVHWWGQGLKRNLIYLHNLHHLLEIGATEWF